MEKPKLEEGWLRWSRERTGDSGWFSVFLGKRARERHKRESLKGEEEEEEAVSNVSAGKTQASRYELII